MMHSQQSSVVNDNENEFLPISVEGDEMLSQLEGQIGDQMDAKAAPANDTTSSWAQKVESGLRSGGVAFSESVSTGRLPDISLSHMAPKIELHKLQGPSTFFGIGQYVNGDDSTRAFTFPAFSVLHSRVGGNLKIFSANYMLLAVIIAVCFSLTHILFIMAMLLLALMWNWVLQLNAEEEAAGAASGTSSGEATDLTLPSTQQDVLESGAGGSGGSSGGGSSGEWTRARALRMLAAYGVTALALYYFASGLLWQIALYSAAATLTHAAFRNNYNYQYSAGDSSSGDGAATVAATDDNVSLGLVGGGGGPAGADTQQQQMQQKQMQMQMMAQAGVALGALAGVAQSMGAGSQSAMTAAPVAAVHEVPPTTRTAPVLVMAV